MTKTPIKVARCCSFKKKKLVKMKMFLMTLNLGNALTVEPVYNGTVLSGHPLLSGQFSKSRLFVHTNAVFVTCIRRPPLLSGRGHPVAVLCLSFFVIFTSIKRPPLNGNRAICYFMQYFVVFKMRSNITIKK